MTVLTEPDGVGYNFGSSADQEVAPHQLLAVSDGPQASGRS